MGKPLILIGDKTSHGGVVIGATMVSKTGEKPIARVGDKATCPIKGHGGTVIIVGPGDPTLIIDGQPAALAGDSTSCGATLIPSQGVTTAG